MFVSCSSSAALIVLRSFYRSVASGEGYDFLHLLSSLVTIGNNRTEDNEVEHLRSLRSVRTSSALTWQPSWKAICSVSWLRTLHCMNTVKDQDSNRSYSDNRELDSRRS